MVPVAETLKVAVLPTLTDWFAGCVVIMGAALTVKIAVLVTFPPGVVVTAIVPVVAPVGTVAVTEVALTAVGVAVVPLNLTAEAPVRLVPVMVTTVPTGPEFGVNVVMVGALAGVAGVGVGVVFVSSPPLPPQPVRINKVIKSMLPNNIFFIETLLINSSL